MSDVAYRATVFISRSDDASETTVLTPIAGAPHSDPFKIATRTGIAGFQPYMDFPTGRRGKIDLLSKKTDVGELSFDIIDMRTPAGGINATRWVTAFVGDKEGTPRFARLKCYIEESLDGGVTWNPFFTGRVRSLALKSDSSIVYKLSLRDLSDDLSSATFTGLPHELVRQTSIRAVTTATSTTLTDSGAAWATNQWVGALVTIAGGKGQGQMRQVSSNTPSVLTVSAAWTDTPDVTSQYYMGYAQLVSVMPVGLVRPYGIAKVTKELKGKVMAIDAGNNWALVHVDADHRTTAANQWTMSLQSAIMPAGFALNLPPASAPDPTKTIVPTFSGVGIARVTRTDTSAEGDFYVGYGFTNKTLTMNPATGWLQPTQLWGLAIKPLVYPIGVATGSPLVNGAQTASPALITQSFNSKGWTASVTGIVKAGDILSFNNQQQRYMVQADANSDGTGLATITVSPGLQVSLVDNDLIKVQRSPGRMDLPIVGTAIKFHVVCDMALAEGSADPFKPGNLLAINDVHPAQVLKDVLLGYFGRVYHPYFDSSGGHKPVALPPGKNLGDLITGVGVQLTDNVGDGRHGFNALVADQTFPPFRCIIDASMPIRDFVEQYICQAYGIGYYFDGSGTFVPVDMRQPSSVPVGSVTLTDADLVADKMPGWSYDPTAAVTWGAYTIYGESMLTISAVLMPGFMFPVITKKMFEVQGGQIIDGELGNLALSDKQYQVDFKGYRAMPGEWGWINQGGINLTARYVHMTQSAIRMAHAAVARPYGHGPMIVTVTARRWSNTAGIYPGSFFVLNTSTNPDPGSNKRGQQRLVLCTERAEDGPTVKLTGTDWGVTLQSNPPSNMGAPAQVAGDPGHTASCLVSPNGEGEPAEVSVNVTPTTVGVRPPDSDPNWMFVRYNWVSWVAVQRGLPGGSRVWWRARTMAKRHVHILGFHFLVNALKLPSGWWYPTLYGNPVDYVDLSTLSPPTGLSSSLISANNFRVSWSNPDSTRQVEVWLATPTSDPRTRIAVLSPGSIFYDFTGLGAGKTYRVAIRTIDGAGGFAEATIDVTTSGFVPFIPPPFSNRGGKLFM